MVKMVRSPATGLAIMLLLNIAVSGQTERFVLGQKLRDCESAWDAHQDVKRRERATTQLKQAVTLFFSLKLGEAARAMDEARFALEAEASPTPERRWAESLYLRLDGRLIDLRRESLGVTLAQMYKTEGAIPEGAILRLTMLRDGRAIGKPAELKVSAIPMSSTYKLTGLPEGDLQLQSEVIWRKQTLVKRQETISLATNVDARISGLKTAFESSGGGNSDVETGRLISGLLASLASGQTLETSYPAVRLLRESEDLAKAVKSGTGFYGGSRSGQFWLSLSLAGGSTVPARLEAPPGITRDRPRPLVIAMHGAGGSENLFFDGYGRGLAADLSRQRGWLIVAPRGSAGFTPGRAAEIVDAVDKLYAVDRKRVYVVGHSMGGSQAVASMQATPESFGGVAVLGGGGQVKADAAISRVPVYIGVGTEDFALPNARRLRDGLENAGVARMRMVESPGIEHLVIVQEALPEVFRFFDSLKN